MPATIQITLDLTGHPQIYPARLHGAACALLETPDSDHQRQYKPFAVGPLYDIDGSTRWRLGWLAEQPPPQLPDRIRLGDVDCDVRAAHFDNTSYARLADSKPARHAQLQVVSPMYFSRNGRDHPLPDPVLIVRNLAQRWNAHAPALFAITDELLRAITGTVFLHAMAGETVRTPVSATMHQTGFFGTVRLGLIKAADHTTRTIFAALMQFAIIAGIGAQTTHGFGAIRVKDLAP
ncbi:CRISPR-associated endoribonuclease Cas6 [Saccharopolyspora kobensis]|uniref:CRISPR-associated endoribonuclease Cas6 n=1 Tax=Saccharopolyspora kobensis TaxID=146035 RepID=A0A1H5VSM9_9PSEU|nr:CRISPR system precrRNA processing endoribonuclease RAMP protein Cas6 [Saccharopolyspora kobensis]SEF89988.1 CRISPR-associated endoribonuclease Cas6 [Saccharopolyspora kobensis]SFC57721.1 CRISPR-associated endoribonuclease Cas6 [Saccharopolyspora kobensis]